MTSNTQDSAQSEQSSNRELVSSASKKESVSNDKQPLLDKTMEKASSLAPVQSVLKQEAKPMPAFRAYVDGLSGPRLGFIWITYVLT